jgi:polar amino acid transport system substrate-binding protein
MEQNLHGIYGWRRSIVAASLWAAAGVAAAAVATDAHEEAVTALQDLRAAVGEVEQSAAEPDAGRDRLVQLGQRAINDVVGMNDARFRGSSGRTSSPAGALGHLDQLIEYGAGVPWFPAITGAYVNARAAVSRLEDALAERGIDPFQRDATDALANLEMAIGRASDMGTLGGVAGALSSTVLGVPAGAQVVSACEQPTDVPAYGTAAGYLVYVALPLQGGEARLPIDLGGSLISVDHNRLIVYTAAEKLRPALCNPVKESKLTRPHPPHVHSAVYNPLLFKGEPTGHFVHTAAPANTHGAIPKLYTEQQAHEGKKLYDGKCASCHGKDLQGTAAPSVAGKDFLETAQHNGWTLDDLRSIVFYNMPFNAPGSLSESQYADLMAYLLAENCYPAGNQPFPSKEDTKLQNIPLKPVEGTGKASGGGMCQVK